jgi:PAS domain S-box-containing protein
MCAAPSPITSEALLESEGLLRAVVEAAVDGIITLDERGLIRTVNPAAERLFGFASHELIGRHMRVLMVENGDSQYLSASTAREVQGRRKDESMFPMELAVSETWVGTRRVFAALIRDISDRKRSDEALRESEERYRATFNQAAIGLTHVAPDGRWLLMNDRFAQIMGYSQEELSHLRVHDVTHPQDIPADRQWWDRLFRGDINSYTIEKRYVRKDSTPIWVNVTRSLVRDPGGQPKYAINIVQDISERKHAEEALRETVGRLRAVVETAADGIITINERGFIESFNAAAERIFGYKASEVLNQHIKFLMPEPFGTGRDGSFAHRRRVEARIVSSGREVEGRRKDGAMFPLDLAVSETRLGNRRIYTGLVRDITERKRVEAELQRHREHLEDLVRLRTDELEASHQRLRISERMAAIGTLSAGLGHDMGNLLLPVRVRLEAMEGQGLTPELREDVRAIHQAADYLSQLARGLKLLAADPDAGTYDEVTSLPEWWRDIRGLLKNLLPKDAVLEVQFADALPPVRIARAALTQAVFNLVQNAADALRSRPQPRVTVSAESAGRGQVRLAVADNGIGMSAETAARCLEPFFTTKTRGISTGLGLSLVQGTVQRVGGRVELQSKPGHGTTFTLLLPSAEHLTEPKASHGFSALISIHEPRVSQFIASLLRPLGFGISTNSESISPQVRIWALQPEAQLVDRARAFVQADPHRRVIFFGALPNGQDTHPQFIVLNDRFIPTVIRDTVREVARVTAA